MTYGEKHKIKTYLVPTSYEVVEAMEKGEAPSFLHVGTCLDDLTNGEVIKKIFPQMIVEEVLTYAIVVKLYKDGFCLQFDLDWWNRKWGE